MKDKIVIVDDTLKDREHLEKAFEGCGLGANVVSFKKIADAKTAILKSGEFPVAIVSDLDTQEGEKLESGKDFLEFEFDESVEQTGGGIWTILVSRHRTKLNEKVKYSHKRGIPRRHFYKDPGWARDCAALIAPLYAQSLPSDKQDALFGPLLPFDRNGELLNCLAPKDRIFLYSGGSSDFSRIKPHCPLVELPESFQRQSHARPIVMYRGHFVVVERNNAQNAAQLLLRWRIVGREERRQLKVTDLIAGVYTQATTRFGKPTLRSEVPGPGTAVHNIVGELRGIEYLSRLSRHLFDRIEAIPQLTERDVRLNQAACPPELSASQVTDGFFTRLHFVLDRSDIAHWEEWLRWRQGGRAS